MGKEMRRVKRVSKPIIVLMYAVCIFFAVLSLLPFVVMIINSTRNTYQVQQPVIHKVFSRQE